ncbi:unnamed protein product [Oikopleura dioica]|uniref:Myotubularin phosphatase domain-containing protein n=1 Tax=Oikopleura dioica TaxID=34765 RepID=E4XNT7_OIKDI|nr:unnamed protein product [Oikopleura dioica]
MICARPNRAKGGGYESHDSYEEHGGTTFIERIFCDIDNIHVMRDSLVKVIEALNNPNKKGEKKWFELLDDSKWMQHLRLILIASNRVVDRIKNNGHSTLIHCSDGWDRTAQLAAVSQLCLDGYYRTLEGFLVLIDKEWCAFGHKFQDRIGHTVNKPQDTERSPVFIQFLDAVYQLMCQFPEAFEFSERLLIFIAEHLFSARFGNFLFNNVKDRLAHNLHTKTRSIWSFILHQDNRRQFLHPIYDKNSHLFTLVPNTSVIRMTFWIRLYNKANPSTPRDQLLEWALKMQQRSTKAAEKSDPTNM